MIHYYHCVIAQNLSDLSLGVPSSWLVYPCDMPLSFLEHVFSFVQKNSLFLVPSYKRFDKPYSHTTTPTIMIQHCSVTPKYSHKPSVVKPACSPQLRQPLISSCPFSFAFSRTSNRWICTGCSLSRLLSSLRVMYLRSIYVITCISSLFPFSHFV